MQLIPAIDILDGKIVRLRQGQFEAVTRYSGEPQELATRYLAAGAARLHLVNLSGARGRAGDESFLAMVREVTNQSLLEVQVGGGIRTLGAIQATLDAGARRVVLGTMLFENESDVRGALLLFGPDRVVAALDARDGEVQIRGWQEKSGLNLTDSCRRVLELGIGEVMVTDIARDGMAEGPNVALYRQIREQFPSLKITASGGIRDEFDLNALEGAGCDAAIIGRALLDGSLDLNRVMQKEPAPSSASKKLGITSSISAPAIRVIPCLDIAGGRVVKGFQFEALRDAGDPVELARKYSSEGADELVFLDITASKDNGETAYRLAAQVAEAIDVPFTIGGGVATVEGVRRLLDAGADKVSLNSAAVANPALLAQVAQKFGSANTVCAIDARRTGAGWSVLVRGGSVDTGMDAIAWAREAADRGAGELLVTSHDRDGSGRGFDIELLSRIRQQVTVPVIASGGGGDLASFVEAVSWGRVDAVLAASVFHFGTLTIRDIKMALRRAGCQVRA
jgi:cyclase